MMEAGRAQKEPKTCQICEQNPSKYLCPRCGVPYCSLSCYKNEAKHLQCSESFYRDCVVEHVRNESSNPEGSKKMQEILQRFNAQYNDQDELQNESLEEPVLDSDDDEPLDKRLAGIDLNNSEDIWKHLTKEEQAEFKNLVKNEECDIIPEWIPWWLDEPENKLITEVTGAGIPEETHLKLSKRQPQILSKIPKMSELTKIQPNEHVAKGLINVVTAYVWTARLFNGDLFDTEKLLEIAGSLICLSSHLSRNGVFKNVEHAVADIPMNACKIPAFSQGGTAIQANLQRDVWIIIKGPTTPTCSSSVKKGYLLSTLTDCYTVFERAVKLSKLSDSTTKLTQDQAKNSFSNLFPTSTPVVSADFKLLKNSKRRLLYLLAFANEYMDNYRDICR